MTDTAIKNELAASKLSDMAGLLKALSEHADAVARLAPVTWASIEDAMPWFTEIGPTAVGIFDKAATDLERAP